MPASLREGHHFKRGLEHHLLQVSPVLQLRKVAVLLGVSETVELRAPGSVGSWGKIHVR